ncbi:hypothetical protein B0H19DRAFT_1142364 [Mycena capillaripes]|nr:hypothetical protein B0H19DRAFT_1142364 [Mycena capillaripes]
MHLGQFSAWITVDDGPLSEYALEHSADGMEATCWIVSENEKKFCIVANDTEPSPQRMVYARMAVDDIKCGCRHLKVETGSHIATTKRDSVSTSENARRPLTFGKQILTDDDAYLDAAISPELGTIKVTLDLVKLCQKMGKQKNWTKPEAPLSIVHERSKKAIGHSVQFGPEFYANNSGERNHSKKIKTLATFIFKYHPIELLRARGIVPPEVREERAAAPADVLDLTMDVDEEDAEEAEIKKLETRLNELKNKRKQVKRKPSDGKKEIKNEGLRFIPREVIDLT